MKVNDLDLKLTDQREDVTDLTCNSCFSTMHFSDFVMNEFGSPTQSLKFAQLVSEKSYQGSYRQV